MNELKHKDSSYYYNSITDKSKSYIMFTCWFVALRKRSGKAARKFTPHEDSDYSRAFQKLL